jgi:hypothetical protein
VLVYCCADLIFATRVRAEADAAGVVSRPARNADMLRARLDRVDDGKPNDPVTGVIVDLDLGETGVALIEQAAAHQTPPRIVAFGPHVAVDLLRQADNAGADLVLPRGRFVQELAVLVRELGGL